MDTLKQIKSILQEAELYRSQGLVYEAREKFKYIYDLIQKNTQVKNREVLLGGLKRKLQDMETAIERADHIMVTHDLNLAKYARTIIELKDGQILSIRQNKEVKLK